MTPELFFVAVIAALLPVGLFTYAISILLDVTGRAVS